MILLVCGSRNIEITIKELDDIIKSNSLDVTMIVSGGAKGPDRTAIDWAEENNVEYMEFLPDWEGYGKSAGIIRNKYMCNISDTCIAFWNGVSRGTGFTVDYMEGLKKPVIKVIKNDKNISNNSNEK